MKIPVGLCQCGCGGTTNLAWCNDKSKGWIKGTPIKFISGHRASGAGAPVWHGGRYSDTRGYVFIKMPEHPRAKNGYVQEHILIAEKALGKYLPPGAVIHHANGTTNSGPLVICQDTAYHSLIHQRTLAYQACGHAGWLNCKYCKQYDDPKNMYVAPNKNTGFHRQCHSEYEKRRTTNK